MNASPAHTRHFAESQTALDWADVLLLRILPLLLSHVATDIPEGRERLLDLRNECRPHDDPSFGRRASILGGRLTDYLTRRYGLRIGRAIGVAAMPISAIALCVAALTQSATVAAVAMTLAAGAEDLCLSPSWAMCHDIGGDAAGTVTAVMNTYGNIGGALSPLVVGYALDWWGSGRSHSSLQRASQYWVGSLPCWWTQGQRPFDIGSSCAKSLRERGAHL
jgi:hypothetical protein